MGAPQRTVLIVDDYPAVLAWASRAFNRAGWKVLAAADGTMALSTYVQTVALGEAVHLLVTDLEMPDLDGASLARSLRSLDPSIGVIAITGHEDRGSEWQGLLLDRTAFFRKPTRASALLAAAEALSPNDARDDAEPFPIEPERLSTPLAS